MRRISIPLALAAAVLAVSAASVSANEPKAAAKTGPASTSPVGGKSQAQTVQLPPDILQRRRRGIAAMLESNTNYLGGLLAGGAAKIVDAKLAGPFEYTYIGGFAGQNVTRTKYCVTATLVAAMRAAPVADITVQNPPEGGERMVAGISHYGLPPECRNADFKPFPELEQLRAQRRRARGYED